MKKEKTEKQIEEDFLHTGGVGFIGGGEKIPEFHQNLPLRAINQVVFNGNEGFQDCQTVLLLQPEKTFTYSFIYHESESAEVTKSNAEFCVDRCLPEAAPPNYILLAINPNGEPKSETARANGFRAFYFLFVEEGAFQFRELEPEDFRPRKLEIKILENGLKFYADASYLIWNEEATVPPEIEAEFGNRTESCGKCGGTGEIALSSTHYENCPECSIKK